MTGDPTEFDPKRTLSKTQSCFLTLLLDEPLRVPHGLRALLLARPLADPHPDAPRTVVHDERVVRHEVGLQQRAALHLGHPQGAVL